MTNTCPGCLQPLEDAKCPWGCYTPAEVVKDAKEATMRLRDELLLAEALTILTGSNNPRQYSG